MSVTSNIKQLRLQFLEYLFGDQESGYVCIAYAHSKRGGFREEFYNWPTEKQQLANFVDSISEDYNVWFCVSFLDAHSRMKEHCRSNTFVWSDLDAVDLETVKPEPTAVLETSPGRYQGFWRLSGESIPGDLAEDYSRRITYSNNGDKGGWAKNKLLRVPWTTNFKYDPPPQVGLVKLETTTYDPEKFDELVPISEGSAVSASEALVTPPDAAELPDIENVLYKFKPFDEEFSRLYTIEPDPNADWSRIMWRFINKLLSMGATNEEAFVVVDNAACNKYKRDSRPPGYLWRDILKAAQDHSKYSQLQIQGKRATDIKMPHLVDFDEFEEDTFIKDYKNWANDATDAPEQYHELGVFMALSSVCSHGLFLETSHVPIIPNLWGLVLGESTLTRKTTAMRLVIDMLNDIDPTLILATDGSAEGLLSGLANRPKRVSIFWKDEVSGLFDSINKKDYLAGLPETLTQLYDVPPVLTRLLRKETVTITEPYFIFFGGGIRDKVYSLLSDEYVLSGFLPRFLVVSGENDLSRLRRTGPPTTISTERKDNIVRSLADIRDRYSISVPITVMGQTTEISSRIEAKLTDDAWQLYGDFESKLTHAGVDNDISMLALPTFTRLSLSLLKMALLVAASRRLPNDSNHLVVEATDIKQAAFYIEKWGYYSIDLMVNTGVSKNEKLLEKARQLVLNRNGITKAEFMQRLRLGARDAKEIIDTLEQRGLISVKKSGRGNRLYALMELHSEPETATQETEATENSTNAK